MMPLDRMPSISLGIIVPAGALYDRHHHWHTDAGEPRASVGFDAGGHSHAADRAESADDPANAGGVVVEGWLADVGRQPRLPGLRVWLALPLPMARAGRRWGRRACRALL